MKKDITKLVLGVSIIAGTMGFLSSDAITLSLNLNSAETSISTNEIVPIHFKEYKNDFGGFIYFQSDDVANSSTDTEDDEDDGDDGDEGFEVSDYEDFDAYEYQINGSSCKFQKRGFYYNAERGERLWPLDQATKEMRHLEDLSMSGGIFSNCSPDLDGYQEELEACGESTSSEEGPTNTQDCVKEVEEKYYDPYSYHGVVTHEYSGQKFALAVGVRYATGTPWIEMKTDLGKTFQYHPGVRHSFGFLYDYNGGVGFAGCEILLSDELNNIIDSGVNDKGITEFFVKSGAIDETPYLIYTGGEGKFECKNIGQDMNSALMILVEGLIGMGNNTSYYKEMDQSVAQKSQYFASININNATMINYARQRAEILCRGKWQSATSTQEGINCINGSYTLTEADKNRTIIVRNGSVTVKPFFNGYTNGYYDIFIDSGNLIIDEPNPGDYTNENDYKFVIKSNGFVDNSCDIECFTDKIADAKNGDPVNYDNLNDIGVASILKGNFIVNGHVKGGNSNNKLNNKYFIYGKLTSLDDNLSLKDTFKWGCLGDEGSDYPCPYSPQTGPNRHSYQNAPLVIIDQNYDSPLFK